MHSKSPPYVLYYIIRRAFLICACSFAPRGHALSPPGQAPTPGAPPVRGASPLEAMIQNAAFSFFARGRRPIGGLPLRFRRPRYGSARPRPRARQRRSGPALAAREGAQSRIMRETPPFFTRGHGFHSLKGRPAGRRPGLFQRSRRPRKDERRPLRASGCKEGVPRPVPGCRWRDTGPPSRR